VTEPEILDREAQKKSLSESVERLRKINQYLSLPEFRLVLEYVSALEDVYGSAILKSKETNEMFSLQGQILGLRVLSNLPAKCENEFRSNCAELAAMEQRDAEKKHA
jgi:hypothetical protein